MSYMGRFYLNFLQKQGLFDRVFLEYVLRVFRILCPDPSRKLLLKKRSLSSFPTYFLHIHIRNKHSTFPSKRHDPETCLRMHMIELHFFVHVKQWALMILGAVFKNTRVQLFSLSQVIQSFLFSKQQTLEFVQKERHLILTKS